MPGSSARLRGRATGLHGDMRKAQDESEGDKDHENGEYDQIAAPHPAVVLTSGRAGESGLGWRFTVVHCHFSIGAML